MERRSLYRPAVLVWVWVVVLSILALVMYAAVMAAERYLLRGMLHGSQLGTQ